MNKFTTILLAGIVAITMTACGGGSSSSTPTETQPPVTQPPELPIAESGNVLVLPGYTYAPGPSDILEMHVKAKGNVFFVGYNSGFRIFDENFNAYNISYNNVAYLGESYEFEPGLYYLQAVYDSYDSFSVQSNVL